MRILCCGLLLMGLAWCEPKHPPSIFDYRKELALTSEQIKSIKEVLRELLASSDRQTKKIEQLDLEYKEMLGREVPMEQAYSKLQELEKARTEWRYTDLKASYRILEILSADQKKKWRQLRSSLR